MRKLIGLALVVVGLAAQPAFGRAPAATEGGGYSSSQRVNLSVLGGLGTSTSVYLGTFLAGVGIPISSTSSTKLMLDTGIIFGSGTMLPILFSIYMPINEARSFRTYFVGSLGPSINLGGTGMFRVNDVHMAFLLRPGGAWHVAEKLDVNIEMMIGGFTGLFYIGPNLGMKVSF